MITKKDILSRNYKSFSFLNEEEEEVEESPVDKLEAELAEAKDKYLRLFSEFDNYRRRTAKEKLELLQTAGERIMVSLLPVIDDFSRAEKSLDSGDAEAIAEGIRLISDKFVKILDSEGLKIMDTKEGTDFDTELHEAVTMAPMPDKISNTVLEVIQVGFTLNGRLVRPAWFRAGPDRSAPATSHRLPPAPGPGRGAPVAAATVLAAGAAPTMGVTEGTAIRIMTGAPIPDGCDCVVMVEDTERVGTDSVNILKSVPAGAAIRAAGSAKYLPLAGPAKLKSFLVP